MQAGKLDRRVTILTAARAQEDKYGTSAITWTELATVWAEVRDVLPGRAESITEGLEIARRPCRVRMRYRSDVTSAMRLRLEGRMLRIVGGPAEIGRRVMIELVAEELSTEGQDA